jgi:hypothetical protein
MTYKLKSFKHNMKTKRNGGSMPIDPNILNLLPNMIFVVSITLRPNYPMGNEHRYPPIESWVCSRADLNAIVKKYFIRSFIHQWLYSPLLGSGLFLNSVIFFYTDVRTPWTSDQSAARRLPTHRTRQTQAFTPWVGFETTIPAFERAKAVMKKYISGMYSME